MRYRNKKKYDEKLANRRNTPYIKENTTVIVLSYLLSGINLVFAGFHSIKVTDAPYPKYLIFVGITMLLMVPISILDNRRSMRGKFATILGCIMHLVICIMLSLILSFWWLAICICEIMLYFLAIIVVRKL